MLKVHVHSSINMNKTSQKSLTQLFPHINLEGEPFSSTCINDKWKGKHCSKPLMPRISREEENRWQRFWCWTPGRREWGRWLHLDLCPIMLIRVVKKGLLWHSSSGKYSLNLVKTFSLKNWGGASFFCLL